MRFDSVKSLISFLEALGNLGYQVPFKDYEKDMKNKGFDRHIHNYNFNIEMLSPTIICVSTTNVYHDSYFITASMDKDSGTKHILSILYDFKEYFLKHEYDKIFNEIITKGDYNNGIKN